MCHEAYILDAESSRRIEKSNNYKVRPPKIMKNDKNIKFSKIWQFVKNINVSFSVFNSIDFLSWTIQLKDDVENLKKSISKKKIKDEKGKHVIH